MKAIDKVCQCSEQLIVLEIHLDFGVSGLEMSTSVVGKFRSFYSTIDQVSIQYYVLHFRRVATSTDCFVRPSVRLSVITASSLSAYRPLEHFSDIFKFSKYYIENKNQCYRCPLFKRYTGCSLNIVFFQRF